MTKREKIEKLATGVMGWHKHQHDQYGYCWTSDNGVPVCSTHWNPYKNIQDAWMIVDRLIQMRYAGLSISHDDVSWFAEFDIAGGGIEGIGGEGKTAQEAICEAALPI